MRPAPATRVAAVALGALCALAPAADARHAGRSAFDGEGADLVIGVPFDCAPLASCFEGAGSATVVYGSPDTQCGPGLCSVKSEPLGQGELYGGVFGGTAEAHDNFGAALAAGHFNSDEHGDLAVAVPREDVGSIPDAGAVNVIYGAPEGGACCGNRAGLDAGGNQLFHQAADETIGSPLPGTAQGGDRLGTALAAGDFNHDGIDDLAIGVPGDDLAETDAGAVNVIYGTPAGLDPASAQILTQTGRGSASERAERGDAFGAALAAGDFDLQQAQDRRGLIVLGPDDLAVGVPDEDLSGRMDGGMVNVFYGGAGRGLDGDRKDVVSQATSDIAGDVEAGDSFGSTVAAGPRTVRAGVAAGDGVTDALLVGVPDEDVGSVRNAGVVNVIPTSVGGPTARGNFAIGQHLASVKGAAEAGDGFGAAVTAVPIANSRLSHVAVGAPGEDVDRARDAGAVHVFYRGSGRITTSGDRLVTQKTVERTRSGREVAIAGAAEAGDLFGAALAAAAFPDPDGVLIAVGIPGEDIERRSDQGAVAMMSPQSAGLNFGVYRDVRGAAGVPHPDGRFGSAVLADSSRAVVE